jgi:hypothetical protein
MQRGMTLKELYPARFHLYEPEEAFFTAEELKAQVQAETIEQFLGALQKVEGVGIADIEGIRDAFQKSPEEGQKAVQGLLAKLEQEKQEAIQQAMAKLEQEKEKAIQEAQAKAEKEKEKALADRAQQLGVLERSQKPPSPPTAVGLSRVGIYLSMLLIIVGISTGLFVLRTTRYQLVGGAGAGAVVFIGILLFMQAVVDHAMARVLEPFAQPIGKLLSGIGGSAGEKSKTVSAPAQESASELSTAPRQKTMEKKTAILEKWLRGDVLRADRAVRHQVALELAQAANSLNEARLKKHWAGDKSGSEALKSLANAADTLRQRIEGAPQYEKVVIKEWKGKAKELGARLIEFEEDLLSEARVFSLASARLLPGLDDTAPQLSQLSLQHPTPESLSAMLRRLERRFSQRDSIFGGLIVMPGWAKLNDLKN